MSPAAGDGSGLARAAGMAGFIRARLHAAPVPLVPEIRLHTAHSSSGLGRFLASSGGAPYWAYPWAGGIALARYLLDHPEAVAGRTAFDLGAGSGLVAIAAAKAGAASVVASEVDANGLTAIALNAALNDVLVTAVHGDATEGPLPHADVILAGDVFYDRRLARTVLGFLERCLAAGRDVLVGDPDRAHLPRRRLVERARYRVPDFGEAQENPPGSAAVYTLASASGAG
jgi:predicted nicotinamide N-methyase